MSSQTSLGRVQPIFRGTYNSATVYNKLDNVLYNNSTWVCLNDGTTGIAPTDSSDYWQLVASRGPVGEQGQTGSFGAPVASASILPTGSDPTVSITTSGPDTAKIFDFEFGIPAGPVGYDDVAATATSLSVGASPIATASLVASGSNTIMQFQFGIPAADGTGIQYVDGTGANSSGDAIITAVRYGVSQSLSDAQKLQARRNIGIESFIADPSASTGQYLYYNDLGAWVGKSINEVPAGASVDTGKYLRKTSNGMIWANVQALPSGGIEGAPLVKHSDSDYDVMWGSAISSNDIDLIISG